MLRALNAVRDGMTRDEISKDYEQTLRLRMATFKEKTNTRKSLVNTFVTTFGVADGIHRSIVDSEVSMEDLFEP